MWVHEGTSMHGDVARCAMCCVGTRGRKLLGDRARSGATYGHPAYQLPNLANPRRRPTLWGRASQHYGGEPPSVWGEPPSSMWGRASHSMLFPACRGEHVVSAQWGRASQHVSTMGASLPCCNTVGASLPGDLHSILGGCVALEGLQHADPLVVERDVRQSAHYIVQGHQAWEGALCIP